MEHQNKTMAPSSYSTRFLTRLTRPSKESVRNYRPCSAIPVTSSTPSPQFETSVLAVPEVQHAKALAFNILDMARVADKNTQEVYVELAKQVVAAVSHTREAEKAAEQAKAAAIRAEMESLRVRQVLNEVVTVVQDFEQNDFANSSHQDASELFG